MTSRSRVLVLAISTPIIAFAFIGGYLGQALAKDDTYQHLRVFEDVVSLVINNYVEPVDVREAMKGAMRGLADNLDPESAYLTPDLARTREANDPGGPAEVGLDVTRQYYLRVVSARDGSPAAKAGIRPGDFIRAIDNRPTRDMSAYEGSRLLRGAPGIQGLPAASSAGTRPTRTWSISCASAWRGPKSRRGWRTARPATSACCSSRPTRRPGSSRPSMRWRRPAPRGTSSICAARRVAIWTRGSRRRGSSSRAERWASGSARADRKEPIAGQPSDGAVTAPVALLVDIGTAGRRRSVCRRARRQRPRRSRRHQHARTRRAPAPGEAARPERPLAHVSALPHAVRRSRFTRRD